MMMVRPEYNMKLIGQNLKRLREAKNLTVEQVREYLCLGSVQAVYKYEQGKGYPQADTMFALMELYEADLHDITCSYEESEELSSFFAEECFLVWFWVICKIQIGKNKEKWYTIFS